MRLVPSPGPRQRIRPAPTGDGDPRRYRALFEQSLEALLVTDGEGIVHQANHAAAARLGLSPHDLVGRPITLSITRPHRRRVERALTRLAGGGSSSPEEVALRLEPLGAPARDAVAEVVRVPDPVSPRAGFLLWALHDVTRHTRAQERLRESRRRYRSLYREVAAQRDELRVLSVRLLRAKEDEARRIAHQLHDEAAQITASVHLALAEVGRDLPPRRRVGLRRVGALLAHLEERLHRLSHELRPTILDDLGLAPAVGFLAEGFSARTGIPVDVNGDMGDSRLDPLIETALYRVVQEALTNVARHARARRLRVRFERRRGVLRCSIRDDGVGFDRSHEACAGEGGLGLLGIRERLEALGGKLQIRSSAGRGTELLVAIPLKRRSCPAGSFSPTITS